MKAKKVLLGALTVGAIAVLIMVPPDFQSVPQPTTSAPMEVPVVQKVASSSRTGAQRELPSLGGATEWLNSPALSPAQLRGKVVVIDVWTYTCINWLRTLP